MTRPPAEIAPPPPDIPIPPDHLNLMGYVNRSEVNGPGCRAVVWVQGCLRACPGCFNPASWDFQPNQVTAIADLVADILADSANEGVTFSGGEPFWQAPALAEVARRVKAQGLNVMSFTGFTLAELQAPTAPHRSPRPVGPTRHFGGRPLCGNPGPERFQLPCILPEPAGACV
jgi:anaerobic ribonucleoside-triphosphate reductase activating protein